MKKALVLIVLPLLLLASCNNNNNGSNGGNTTKNGMLVRERVKQLSDNIDTIPSFGSSTNNTQTKNVKKLESKKVSESSLTKFPEIDESKIVSSSYQYLDNDFVLANSTIEGVKSLKESYVEKVTEYGTWLYEYAPKQLFKLTYNGVTDSLKIETLETTNSSNEFGYTVVESSYNNEGRIQINYFSYYGNVNGKTYTRRVINYVEGVSNTVFTTSASYARLEMINNCYLVENTINEETFVKGQEKRTQIITSDTYRPNGNDEYTHFKSNYTSTILSKVDNYDVRMQINKTSYYGNDNPTYYKVEAYNEKGYQVLDYIDNNSTNKMVMSTLVLDGIQGAYYIPDEHDFQNSDFYLKVGNHIYGSAYNDKMDYSTDGFYPSRILAARGENNTLIFSPAISFEINIGNIDTNFSDVVVTGFTQYGISIKDEAKSTMLSLLNNYKNIIHSRSAFGIEHLDEANKSIIDEKINSSLSYYLSFNDIMDLLQKNKGEKSLEEQSETNDRITNLNINIDVKAQLVSSTSMIKLDDASYTLKKSQLLNTNNTYSLVYGLQNGASFIELGRVTKTYNDENINFTLTDESKEISINDFDVEGDYTLVAFFIEKSGFTDKENRISNVFKVEINDFTAYKGTQVTYDEYTEIRNSVKGFYVYEDTYKINSTITKTLTYSKKNGNLQVNYQKDVVNKETLVSSTNTNQASPF